MTTYGWPAILKPRDFGFFPLLTDTSGGAALGGGEQFVISMAGRWGAAMTLSVKNKSELLALRTLRIQLMGRANTVALPNFDGKRLSWPIEVFNGNPIGVVLRPKVTRNRRLDGTVYADLEIPAESEIDAELQGAVEAGDTACTITVNQGEAPLSGQQFGLVGRLYEIATVTVAGGNYDLTFWPPLRNDHADATAVKFTRPICKMRCMNLNDELRKLELLRFATLNLEFIEDDL